MRVIRQSHCVIAHSFRASQACVHSILSHKRHTPCFIPGLQLHATAGRFLLLCDGAHVDPSASQEDDDLNVWAQWLPCVTNDSELKQKILLERHFEEILNPAGFRESARDLPECDDMPTLLMSSDAPQSPTIPAIISAVDIAPAARTRISSAAFSFLAVALSSSSSSRQIVALRHRLAISGHIIARIHAIFCKSAHDAASLLFMKSLRRLRAAASRPSDSIFPSLSAGNFSSLRDRLAAGEVLLSRAVHYNGRSPLHYAVIFDNLPLAQALVAACADVNAQDAQGFSPISYAAIYDHEAIFRLLYNSKADVNARGNNGWSPIHLAAKRGHLQAVELLIAAGATINLSTADSSSAIFIAAECGQAAVVRRLVACGASVGLKDAKGLTPLHAAAKQQGLISACGLASKAASAGRWWQVADALLSGGADVNAKDAKGCTALHYAVKNESGSIELVKVLVTARADINAKNKSSKSPLQYAGSNRFSATIAEYLLRVQTRMAEGRPLPDA